MIMAEVSGIYGRRLINKWQTVMGEVNVVSFYLFYIFRSFFAYCFGVAPVNFLKVVIKWHSF